MDLLKSSEFNEIIHLAKEDKNIVALILFGSYAKGNFKDNSDVDLCIFKANQDLLPHDFEIIKFQERSRFDILFFNNLPDEIKFRIFKEGKVLVLNDSKNFFKTRKQFLHRYRDEIFFRERQMNKLLAKI